jgi:glycosyltransferase involved in cell wall biosynthesis
MTDSYTAERLLVFVPAYNCKPQIGRVVRQLAALPRQLDVEALILDNRSEDGTVDAASRAAAEVDLPVRVARNVENLGLGGSHKAAFEHAVREGYDYVVVLHGDDQGSIADLVPALLAGVHRSVDALLGARFMPCARLEGYSALRTFGNRAFNLLFSAAARTRLRDLGSGLNLYRVETLARHRWQGFADDLTFNYFMILASVAWGWRIRFFPITWRESDQVSNVRLVRQARRMLWMLAQFTFDRQAFLARPHAILGRRYAFEVVFDNGAASRCMEAPR